MPVTHMEKPRKFWCASSQQQSTPEISRFFVQGSHLHLRLLLGTGTYQIENVSAAHLPFFWSKKTTSSSGSNLLCFSCGNFEILYTSPTPTLYLPTCSRHKASANSSKALGGAGCWALVVRGNELGRCWEGLPKWAFQKKVGFLTKKMKFQNLTFQQKKELRWQWNLRIACVFFWVYFLTQTALE